VEFLRADGRPSRALINTPHVGRWVDAALPPLHPADVVAWLTDVDLCVMPIFSR
jgi:hypothetical protein